MPRCGAVGAEGSAAVSEEVWATISAEVWAMPQGVISVHMSMSAQAGWRGGRWGGERAGHARLRILLAGCGCGAVGAGEAKPRGCDCVPLPHRSRDAA
eukprot:350077-Chlamydomonas_euryale.AAC.22